MKLPDSYKNHIISEGTLDEEDLIKKFTDFLKNEVDFLTFQEYLEEEELRLSKQPNFDGFYFNEEELEELKSYYLNEYLFDLMNEISPENCIFSSHEGDGACFGYWECESEEK